MIIGEFHDETLEALVLLYNSNYKFVICGSRYFGDANRSSDFDFIIQHSYEIENWLNNNKFVPRWNIDKQSQKRVYTDINTVSCWELGQVRLYWFGV